MLNGAFSRNLKECFLYVGTAKKMLKASMLNGAFSCNLKECFLYVGTAKGGE